MPDTDVVAAHALGYSANRPSISRICSCKASTSTRRKPATHLVLSLEPVKALVDSVELGVNVPFEAVYGLADNALDVRKEDLLVELGQNRECERRVRHARILPRAGTGQVHFFAAHKQVRDEPVEVAT